jgi:transposase InsO family protein
MVSPSSRRKAARHVVDSGLGRIAQACRVLGLPRSGYYRSPKISQSKRQAGNRIVALSRKHPRYGYRRITALLRREGRRVNAKRVARIRRAEGLQVRKRQRRLRRVGPSQTQRLRATRRNQVWSWDFVLDQTQAGSAFRILTLLDEHTRECLAVHVAWSIRAQDVLRVLEAAIARHGAAEHIRSDNGPEFVAYAIEDWMEQKRVKTLYIKPGSPWENGHIESFHDKLRDECLNREVFATLAEAKVIIEQWRREYNEYRPHSSLGYRTPAEVAARCQTPLRPALAPLVAVFAAFDSAAEPHEIPNPTTLELHL